MRKLLLFFMLLFISHSYAYDSVQTKLQRHFYPGMTSTPVPTSCITSVFSKSGSSSWYSIALKLTNNCGSSVDMQGTTITFSSGDNINNTSFWGNFGVLSYPDNTLVITTQPQGSGYIASMYLHFPEAPWANTILPAGQSITIDYGAPSASYDPTSVKVYTGGGTPTQTGQIALTNTTLQPSAITQPYAVIDVVFSGQIINKVQLPWSGTAQVPSLSPGAYTLQPESLTDSQGNSYQGTATPSAVTVTANQTVSSSVSYAEIMKYGSIVVQTSALPSVLSGYTGSPSVTFTRGDTGASVSQTVSWGASTVVSTLANGIAYNLSTANITYNGYRCAGTFTPASLTSSATTPPVSQLTYNCLVIAQDQIPVSVSGLPSSVNSINVTFQPSDGSAPVTQAVSISGGSGTGTVTLTDGVVYNVSSTAVSGYSPLFQPQPLTATKGGTETIQYTQQQGGRIIAYVVGWKTPPSATSLAAAGYTNVLASFGVFSTTSPGQIVNAFTTITPSYIASLHQAGIKVSLSLGGASTSIADTSVNFHQVLSSASSPAAFESAFVSAIESTMTQYGFDGVDFDIEQGFGASGTFTSPTGDIAALASIINKLHSDMPNMLISLVPQAANVSATSGFSDVWGNYSSLIMQTYNALSWVGVQIYNTGCVYGINLTCYADNANSPDLSVALAADLLENWPAKTASGQATGFQPYLSYLTPNQVVLGYPAPDASGNSDGRPVKPTAVIKRAIQCLRTGVVGSNSCDTYAPPHLYPNFGGVFEWESTYDQSNNFLFASSLKSCVVSGSC